MANEEQLAILRQGVDVWNKWRIENILKDNQVDVDLTTADLSGLDLPGADFSGVYLTEATLRETNLMGVDFSGSNLYRANLSGTDLFEANLRDATLIEANLNQAKLHNAIFLRGNLENCIFSKTELGTTTFGGLDLSNAIGLEEVIHQGPSTVGADVLSFSKGRIPDIFLQGCGFSDWEIKQAKLFDPHLSNEEINDIQYKIYDLRASRALQISPLFISYSHTNGTFVDKVGDELTKKGIRYWRDIHDMKAGRMEKQIDQAIRQNPTVLLVLSENSLSSDWVEHEVRTARQLEKDTERDVLCPVALDDSWKSSRWSARIMEQIMEYNILDFSEWEDDVKFEGMFRKLIDGLQLFYKG